MKKYLIILVLIICITESCHQNNLNNDERIPTKTSLDSTDNKPIISEAKDNATFDNLVDFGLLVPINILEPNSENVYEKFGIDFDGNCYTCDLAFMRIDKKNFDIVNVCDKNDFYRNEDWAYKLDTNKLIIKTKKTEFIFSKIEGAPVYELKIVGDSLLLENKRISQFYTQQKELKKFQQHDCDEFDG